MVANNYAKQPSGRIVDVSFACYATDYLLFLQCFILYYQAKSISKKISANQEKYDKEDNKLLSTKLIFRLLPYMIVTEACALLLGGLFHHLYPGQQVIFDTAGWFSQNCSMIFLFLIIVTFYSQKFFGTWTERIYKYASNNPRHVLFVIGILSHIEQTYIKILCFKKIKAVLYLIGFLSSLVITESELAKNHSNFKGFFFKLKRFRIACFLFMASSAFYLKIENGCRKPNAHSGGTCPLPDSFNHNAFIHVAFGVVFQMVVGSWVFRDLDEGSKDD